MAIDYSKLGAEIAATQKANDDARKAEMQRHLRAAMMSKVPDADRKGFETYLKDPQVGGLENLSENRINILKHQNDASAPTKQHQAKLAIQVLNEAERLYAVRVQTDYLTAQKNQPIPTQQTATPLPKPETVTLASAAASKPGTENPAAPAAKPATVTARPANNTPQVVATFNTEELKQNPLSLNRIVTLTGVVDLTKPAAQPQQVAQAPAASAAPKVAAAPVSTAVAKAPAKEYPLPTSELNTLRITLDQQAKKNHMQPSYAQSLEIAITRIPGATLSEKLAVVKEKQKNPNADKDRPADNAEAKLYKDDLAHTASILSAADKHEKSHVADQVKLAEKQAAEARALEVAEAKRAEALAAEKVAIAAKEALASQQLAKTINQTLVPEANRIARAEAKTAADRLATKTPSAVPDLAANHRASEAKDRTTLAQAPAPKETPTLADARLVKALAQAKLTPEQKEAVTGLLAKMSDSDLGKMQKAFEAHLKTFGKKESPSKANSEQALAIVKTAHAPEVTAALAIPQAAPALAAANTAADTQRLADAHIAMRETREAEAKRVDIATKEAAKAKTETAAREALAIPATKPGKTFYTSQKGDGWTNVATADTDAVDAMRKKTKAAIIAAYKEETNKDAQKDNKKGAKKDAEEISPNPRVVTEVLALIIAHQNGAEHIHKLKANTEIHTVSDDTITKAVKHLKTNGRLDEKANINLGAQPYELEKIFAEGPAKTGAAAQAADKGLKK